MLSSFSMSLNVGQFSGMPLLMNDARLSQAPLPTMLASPAFITGGMSPTQAGYGLQPTSLPIQQWQQPSYNPAVSGQVSYPQTTPPTYTSIGQTPLAPSFWPPPTWVNQVSQPFGSNRARFINRRGDVQLRQQVWVQQLQGHFTSQVRGSAFYGNEAIGSHIRGNVQLDYQNEQGHNRLLMTTVAGDVHIRSQSKKSYNQVGVEQAFGRGDDVYELSGASSVYIDAAEGEQRLTLDAKADERGSKNYLTLKEARGQSSVLLGDKDTFTLNTNGANGNTTHTIKLTTLNTKLTLSTANAGKKDTIVIESDTPITLAQLKQLVEVKHFDEQDEIRVKTKGEPDLVLRGLELHHLLKKAEAPSVPASTTPTKS